VAEFGFGVLADVSLDLFPVAALIADAFARRADRQNASQNSTDIFGVAYHVRSAARFLIMKVSVIPGAILAAPGHQCQVPLYGTFFPNHLQVSLEIRLL